MCKAHGLNGYQLMDLATDHLMFELLPLLKEKKSIVVCGPGDNGGDGYALAKKARSYGLTMDICNANNAVHKSSQATQLFYRQVRSLGIHILEPTISFDGYDIIIDCLFGSGLNRPLTDLYLRLVKAINQTQAQIIAIDLPSGMNGDHYDAAWSCVHADMTLTIGGYKPVMVNGSARRYCGKIIPIDLWDTSLWSGLTTNTVVEPSDLKDYVPKRKIHSHKGSYGKGLLIGGSRRMGGALLLAAKAALKSGMGTTSVMLPQCIEYRFGINLPEVMLICKQEDHEGFMDDQLNLDEIKAFDVIAIGNGMGIGQTTFNMVKTLLSTDKTIVIDGDGLNVLTDMLPLLNRNGQTILTPHLKEMARLCNKDIVTISEHPFEILDDFKRMYPNVTVLLKDDWMFTSDGSNHVVIPLGNNGLAKGGSGDTLCGLTISMMAQCNNAYQSVVASSMLLGLTSQICQSAYSSYCMSASDLIDALPQVLISVEE